MRSLAEVRQHRVVLIGGGHAREGELRRLLEHADFNLVSFHRRGSQQELQLSDAMLDAELSPPPDAIVLAAGSVITTLRALEQHPVLRWVDPIVAPWASLDEGVGTPLRIEQLLSHLQASHQDRIRVSKELSNARRAVFQLAPLGPLPLLLAAASTKGTTLVFESGVGRARISLAHGRLVQARATDAAQLRTVRGIEALAVALRLPEAEVLVVNDEEDEPIGELLEDALHLAIGMEPTIEMSSTSFLRPAPRVVEGRREDQEAMRAPGRLSSKTHEATLRFGKVVEDEPRTKLWHRPLSREWPESPPEKRHASTQRYGFPSGSEISAEEDESSMFGLPDSEVRPSVAAHSDAAPLLATSVEASSDGTAIVSPTIFPRPASLTDATPAAFAETVLVGITADRVSADRVSAERVSTERVSAERVLAERVSQAVVSLPPPATPTRSPRAAWMLGSAASALGLAAAVWLWSLSSSSPLQVEIDDHAASRPAGAASTGVASTPSAALFVTPSPTLPVLLAPVETAPVEEPQRARSRSRRHHARHAPSVEVASATSAQEAPSSAPSEPAAAPAALPAASVSAAPSSAARSMEASPAAPAAVASPASVASPTSVTVPPPSSSASGTPTPPSSRPLIAPSGARDPSVLTPPDSV